MLAIRTTDEFDKDLVRAKRELGLDVDELLAIVRLLSSGNVPEEVLSAYKDHPLRGRWADCQDLHVDDDLILVYKIDDNALNLVRLATHAQLEKWNY